jgi:arabinogalactan oligomer/maltooligosaccharide transport system permease protein
MFLFPTIVAVLIFNIYPTTLNIYISFTNRNKFRPNPDCTAGLTGVLDPLCWPSFRDNIPVGIAEPYRPITPIFKNYTDLLGTLFTPEALIALVQILVCFVPLVVANSLNNRFSKQLMRPVPAWLVWSGGVVVTLLLMLIVNFGKVFGQLLDTGDFIVVVMRTIIFVILRVPLTFVIGLVLALVLNTPDLRGRTFFRVALFVPWGASAVAILLALVWQFFFRQQGTINQILSALFNVEGPVWLNNPISAMIAIVLADIWFSYPFFMVSILGALQSIPGELYEAADVDGANWWQQLLSITLPLIRPAVMPALVLTSITAFQMFGTAYAMTGGGPQLAADKPGATELVMVYAYRQIYQVSNYGRATAFAVMIFIMLFLATLYSLRITKVTQGAR